MADHKLKYGTVLHYTAADSHFAVQAKVGECGGVLHASHKDAFLHILAAVHIQHCGVHTGAVGWDGELPCWGACLLHSGTHSVHGPAFLHGNYTEGDQVDHYLIYKMLF